MGRVVAVSISIPKRLYELIEEERKIAGLNRSAFFKWLILEHLINIAIKMAVLRDTELYKRLFVEEANKLLVEMEGGK